MNLRNNLPPSPDSQPYDDDTQILVSELLRRLLQASFGGHCINFASLADAGTGVAAPEISRGYFSARITAASETPVNDRCKKELLALYRFGMTESRREVMLAVPTGVFSAFQEFELLTIETIAMVGRAYHVQPYREHEISFIVELIGAFAEEVRGKKAVSKRRLSEALDVVAAYHRESFDNASGESSQDNVAFYRTHGDVGYSRLIRSAKRTIDIVNVHGQSWISIYKDDIREALKREGLKIRVAFLDCMPEEGVLSSQGGQAEAIAVADDDRDEVTVNGYYEAFCLLRRTEVRTQRKKADESIKKWRELYKEAARENGSHADLELRLGRWYPAMSLYRFDDIIIVRPANDVENNTRDFSLGFTKTGGDGHDSYVFRCYRRIIKEVFDRYTTKSLPLKV